MILCLFEGKYIFEILYNFENVEFIIFLCGVLVF